MSSRQLSAATASLDTPLAMLGGLTPSAFMETVWQRRPLVIRQAFDAAAQLPSRAELFAMAKREDVESRLVQDQAQRGWTLKRGPIARTPPLRTPQWTLLVQGVDLHHGGAHALMQQFRFVPDARLDDIMISWASDGGGVGPHTDRYDVFLLQVHGTRRWSIAPPADYAMVPGLPLRIIDGFVPEQQFDLHPGDMLYLPPMWAHDGVAVGGDCMTCSVGFTVPQADDLARELVLRMAEHWEDETLYADPDQAATQAPASVPKALQGFAREALARMVREPGALACALGEWLTEPKARVWFEPSNTVWGQGDVVLDRKTKMMFDAQHVFINGEAFQARGTDAQCLRAMANARCLAATDLRRMSADAQAVIAQWHELGWVHTFS